MAELGTLEHVMDLIRRLMDTPKDQEGLFFDRLNDVNVAIGELDPPPPFAFFLWAAELEGAPL
jgi:hypothetical protein